MKPARQYDIIIHMCLLSVSRYVKGDYENFQAAPINRKAFKVGQFHLFIFPFSLKRK